MNRSQRCGQCRGCQAKPCGRCIYCQDSPQFGGPGVKKQSCIERRCLKVLENRLQRDGPSLKAKVGCNNCDECMTPNCQTCLICLDRKFFSNQYLPGAMCAKKRCNQARSLDLSYLSHQLPPPPHNATTTSNGHQTSPQDYTGTFNVAPSDTYHSATMGLTSGPQKRISPSNGDGGYVQFEAAPRKKRSNGGGATPPTILPGPPPTVPAQQGPPAQQCILAAQLTGGGPYRGGFPSMTGGASSSSLLAYPPTVPSTYSTGSYCATTTTNTLPSANVIPTQHPVRQQQQYFHPVTKHYGYDTGGGLLIPSYDIKVPAAPPNHNNNNYHPHHHHQQVAEEEDFYARFASAPAKQLDHHQAFPDSASCWQQYGTHEFVAADPSALIPPSLSGSPQVVLQPL